MKCKDCIYCTGTQCYGHGEYWATCKLIESIYNQLKGRKSISITECICDEDDKCKILKAIEDAKKWNNLQYREIFEEKSKTIYKALQPYEPQQNDWNINYRIKQRDLLIKHYKEKFKFD